MSVAANTVANYVGRAWSTVMGLLFLPLYIHELGVEAYGIIGAFAVLQAATLVFDFGLTPTLNRELARLRGGLHTVDGVRDLLRSVECVYLVVITLVGLAIYLAAGTLATHWLDPRGLPEAQVRGALQVMAIVLATRWLEQLYRSAIQGLQDQVWLNVIQAGLDTIRWGGAYLFIRFGTADVIAFFWFQLAASVISVCVLASRTYRILPPGSRVGRFDIQELVRVRSFAGGMFLTAVLVFMLTQVDKILVAKLSSLASFGIYSLASTAAMGLVQLIAPMNISVYPRMAEYVAAAKETELRTLFLSAAQWLAALLIPPALLMAVFPESVLLLWTGDTEIVSTASALLAVLSLAMLMNGLTNLPYMLQLAHGWTSLSNITNLIFLSFMIPALIVLIPIYGPITAAIALLAFNLINIAIGGAIMFSRILRSAGRPWAAHAVIAPLAVGASGALLCRLVLGAGNDRLTAALILMPAGALITLCVFASLPIPRRHAVDFIKRLSRGRSN